MKRKIKVNQVKVEEVEVEVEFPIYRVQRWDYWDYHTRIDENLDLVEIAVGKQADGSVMAGLEIGPHSFGTDGSDYSFGRGKFAGSKTEFDAALATLREAVAAAQSLVQRPVNCEGRDS